jgi:hypothetical protein
MAEGGDVFVLDMGKPVRIADLARRMINLMGLTVRDELHPKGDIEISYTGLRPAEKLYEELMIGNNATGTQHPMILRAIEHSLPWERVQFLLDECLVAMSRFDCHRALHLLREVVVEYKAEPESLDLVWSRQAAMIADDRKVTNLKPRGIVRNLLGTDDESTPCNPVNHYEVTKLAAAKIVGQGSGDGIARCVSPGTVSSPAES